MKIFINIWLQMQQHTSMMADAQSHKFDAVVYVIAVIFALIAGFLFYIDFKLRKLEK
ncbi:MAG: hypothetical protein ACK44P_00900 [Bacteroidota bacterium]|jgi:hypothetical protein|nr:hypothetical protein [Sphingobacteriales bacterium]